MCSLIFWAHQWKFVFLKAFCYPIVPQCLPVTLPGSAVSVVWEDRVADCGAITIPSNFLRLALMEDKWPREGREFVCRCHVVLPSPYRGV